MLPDDFCVFILSHGRPNKVLTLGALKRSNYSGKTFIVIDDEDKTADAYKAKFGDSVIQFCKAEAQSKCDDGINSGHRGAVVYARNACWDIARDRGIKAFWVLDDDYTNFYYCVTDKKVVIQTNQYRIKQLDAVLASMLAYIRAAPIASIAMAQSGDFMGGVDAWKNKNPITRKCMNSFLCLTDRPFPFMGKINEDVTAYVDGGKRGLVFFTLMDLGLQQTQTQSNAGGLTDIYLDSGTYVKSFYSVMWTPSCVKVSLLKGNKNTRLHHSINWPAAVPKIIRERYRKASIAAAAPG